MRILDKLFPKSEPKRLERWFYIESNQELLTRRYGEVLKIRDICYIPYGFYTVKFEVTRIGQSNENIQNVYGRIVE